MFPSSPLLETVLEGTLISDPSNLDALPIICQEDIDSPWTTPPPPIRWGGWKDNWRDGIPPCPCTPQKSSLMNEEGEDIFLF
ncbi:hypothetical protein CEXT_494321 [Caerostris extrusa]|uniref:Uncharacterized protein n=1 Tax=Caerostris extrusa TaxID=172846 RepID=A0AAV4YFC3_CAEEX|nr:hypothetical protein CEXT_494321 [Caerostris extrusa]